MNAFGKALRQIPRAARGARTWRGRGERDERSLAPPHALAGGPGCVWTASPALTVPRLAGGAERRRSRARRATSCGGKAPAPRRRFSACMRTRASWRPAPPPGSAWDGGVRLPAVGARAARACAHARGRGPGATQPSAASAFVLALRAFDDVQALTMAELWAAPHRPAPRPFRGVLPQRPRRPGARPRAPRRRALRGGGGGRAPHGRFAGLFRARPATCGGTGAARSAAHAWKAGWRAWARAAKG